MRRVFSRTIYCIAIILPSLVAVTAHPSQTLRQPTSGKGFSLHNEKRCFESSASGVSGPSATCGHGTPIASANSARIGPSTLGKGTVLFSAHTSAEMPGSAFYYYRAHGFLLGKRVRLLQMSNVRRWKLCKNSFCLASLSRVSV